MSIKRWDFIPLDNPVHGITVHTGPHWGDEGVFVLYADHVAAVAAAQTASIRETWDLAVEAERARIRAAAQALYTRMWDESQDFPASEDVLAIIDGGE